MEVIRQVAGKYKTLKTVYAKKKRSKKLGQNFVKQETGGESFSLRKINFVLFYTFFSLIDLPV